MKDFFRPFSAVGLIATRTIRRRRSSLVSSKTVTEGCAIEEIGLNHQSWEHPFIPGLAGDHVTCNNETFMATISERVEKHRTALRKAGLRPLQIWVPRYQAEGIRGGMPAVNV